ncbi:hypothetical protein [Bacillus sp. B1-WWTP-T-0.5-Post-4]|uniref:hypothetical protein n=1 Tax=Bacillus sp. B1-WWTP-T-0.5-Post-4 TaxID=2653219 RepID=UPI0012625AD1|nr:hypothetical protein [Bacillus sp. B1-WWTP-T-0.5-Post-4]KAB7675001.1 hypothetical protein GBN91_28290 [Bacillus sp. B1-WWTP-T-0.5-Post-4]
MHSSLLLPNIHMATATQVAEFLGIHISTVRKIQQRNTVELKHAGVISLIGTEVAQRIAGGSTPVVITNRRGHMVVEWKAENDDNQMTTIPHSHVMLFTKQAVVIVAMHLRNMSEEQKQRVRSLVSALRG